MTRTRGGREGKIKERKKKGEGQRGLENRSYPRWHTAQWAADRGVQVERLEVPPQERRRGADPTLSFSGGTVE